MPDGDQAVAQDEGRAVALQQAGDAADDDERGSDDGEEWDEDLLSIAAALADHTELSGAAVDPNPYKHPDKVRRS